jgi:oligopeptide transport system ATP-binding protein
MLLTPVSGVRVKNSRVMMSPLLEVKNLSTHFLSEDGLVKAVDNISYDLNEGETLGLVGESGCGKSVSALSLLRLIPNPPGKIVNGEIIFQSQDLLKLSEEEICHVRGNEIAMIFQEPMTSLNPVLTIGRQIAEPMELHTEMSEEEVYAESINLLNKVQIPEAETRLSAYPHLFSGGMRQRAMIAMGLGCKPSLIIADEPTTALDVTIQAQLLELLKGLTRDSKTALIIITHNLGVVARYADRVNVMYAGRIVEKGTAREIYGDPRHPYTIGLMASIPRLDQDLKKKLVPIEGQPPDLLAVPKGCAFHPRCGYAVERCREETPELKLVDNKHEVACWVNVKK